MPNFKIMILPSAEKDMQNIFDYIAKDNKKKANKLINIFENKILLLSEFPKSGCIKSQMLKRNVRVLIVAKHYQIIYHIKENTIYILRVLTGYQDIFNAL